VTSTRSLRPRLLALLLASGGVFVWVRPDASPEPNTCQDTARACIENGSAAGDMPSILPTLSAADFCVDVGYLCAGLPGADGVRLRRWRGFEGAMVVHVPLPALDDVGLARRLQQAAVQGIRVWNNHPFPILADVRGDRNPRFSISWKPALSGSQIGVARIRWSSPDGLSVDGIELPTLVPGAGPETVDPRQVRLTAAHEMGHALGLPHSDNARDVMYPTNTATSMSAQDYRSIEVLYGVRDGTAIIP